MTERQLAYREYLKSEHWARLRQEAFARDGRKCVECGRSWNLEGHHKFYRARWEDGVIDDIVTLCDEHHRAKHPEKQAAPVVAVVPVRKPHKPEPAWKDLPVYCRNNKPAWKLKRKHKSGKARNRRRRANDFVRPRGMDYGEYQFKRQRMLKRR